MSAHTCTTLTPGCYRCELHKDEIRGWIDSLVVTLSGVVHEWDCTYLRPSVLRMRWQGAFPAKTDRACTRCLYGELPTLP